MEKFRLLEHKADFKIRTFGKTKEELFLNSLLAMAEGQRSDFENEKEIERKIKIKSFDLESLLVDFLSEALYLSQVNSEACFKGKFKKFTDTEIEGILIGKKVKRFGLDIKAVTYHGLKIKKKDDTLETTVLFDI